MSDQEQSSASEHSDNETANRDVGHEQRAVTPDGHLRDVNRIQRDVTNDNREHPRVENINHPRDDESSDDDEEASVQTLSGFDSSQFARSILTCEKRNKLYPSLVPQVENRERFMRSAFAISTQTKLLTVDNFAAFEFQMERLLRLEQDFGEAHNQREISERNSKVKKRELADTVMAQTDFETIYESAMSRYYALKVESDKRDKERTRASLARSAPPTPSKATEVVKSQIKLPALQLPIFNGNLTDWRQFKNLFEVAIHAKSNLSGAEKLTYLISRLQGEPLRRVKNFSPSEENYQAAWTLLCEYYDSDRRHLNTHYTALRQLPEAKTRSDIPTFLITLQEHVYALQALKVDVSGMEPFLVSSILARFSEDVKGRFEDFRDDCTAFPTYAEVEKYLKRESMKVIDAASSAKSDHNSNSSKSKPAASPKVSFAPGGPTVAPDPISRQGQYRGTVTSPPHPPPSGNHCPVHSCNAAVPSRPAVFPESASQRNGAPNQSPYPPRRNSNNSGPAAPRNLSCKWCHSTQHSIFGCTSLRSLPVSERQRMARDRDLCLNCLSAHAYESCPSSRHCMHCEGKHAESRHHTLLCPLSPAIGPRVEAQNPSNPVQNANPARPAGLKGGSPQRRTSSENSGAPSAHSPSASIAMPWPYANHCANPTTSLCASVQENDVINDSRAPPPEFARKAILLPTALVRLQAANGFSVTARALIDSGSTHCLVSSRCAQLLHLKPAKPMSDGISGVGDITTRTQGVVEATLISRHGQIFRENQSWMVMKKLTSALPPEPVSPELRKLFPEDRLADPNFDIPGPIDCLIGWDLVKGLFFGEYLDTGLGPVYIDSFFGVVFGGLAFARSLPPPRPVHPVVNLSTVPLPEQLERFSTIEALPSAPKWSPDEEAAMEHFEKTTVLLPEGRFQVRLPFRKNRATLGDSRMQAQRRFAALERRFKKDELFAKLYKEMMSELIESGYLHPFPLADTLPREHYFLAHHGVLKESSESTKLRVVYDASAKSSSGFSLNDVLYPGPKLQTNIWTVLTNFRLHAVAISCDIRQMYLQIVVHPDDQSYQLVLWRTENRAPVEILTMQRVSFGENSSPFIAIACLHKLSEMFESRLPRAATVLHEGIYIDDVATGARDVTSARELLDEIVELLALGSFSPHKFFSSHPEVLSHLPPEKIASPRLRFEDVENPTFGVLGVSWVSAGDYFTYDVKNIEHPRSKRGIVSQVASLFDPLGLASAVILRGKRYIQLCWSLKLSWDEEVPADIWQRWQEFYRALPALGEIRVPRCLVTDISLPAQLHIFSDASELGYGAVAYLRSAPSTSAPARVVILASKTRVAPLSRVSLPRLELCGADLSGVLYGTPFGRASPYPV